MKILYLDCAMGAAGDMLTAALLELVPDKEKALADLNTLGIPGVLWRTENTSRCGITGTLAHVEIGGHDEGEEGTEAAQHSVQGSAHAAECGESVADQRETGFGHIHESCQDDEMICHGEHDHGGHDHTHHADAHHHRHQHTHGHSLQDILTIAESLTVSDKVKADICAVFLSIAKAESQVHGRPVDQIHFHEVGTMDALADVAAVSYLMEMLSPDRVITSPIHVGCGTVKCAHGILPVPAPATALLLKDVPIYGGSIQGELCTPTGAALLKHFTDEFGSLPLMKTEKIGYGLGKKEFEAANALRAMLGESAEEKKDQVIELACNLDDMTGEAVGFATELLMSEGARDVFTTPVSMKKNRPGILLTVLCSEEDEERMVRLIFKHTTTLGIRRSVKDRYVLERRIETIETPDGPVRKKISEGYGVRREKTEYEDRKEAALKQGSGIL